MDLNQSLARTTLELSKVLSSMERESCFIEDWYMREIGRMVNGKVRESSILHNTTILTKVLLD